jgi:hypothetical protein
LLDNGVSHEDLDRLADALHKVAFHRMWKHFFFCDTHAFLVKIHFTHTRLLVWELRSFLKSCLAIRGHVGFGFLFFRGTWRFFFIPTCG